ncbi:hypothetical protein ACHAXS_007036 [Conticribra weissflogii]
MSQQLPIRIVSKVVRGYGRGSKDLGIPTANVSRDKDVLTCSAGTDFDELPTGIYWGFARIGEPTTKTTTAPIPSSASASTAEYSDAGDNGHGNGNGDGVGEVYTAAISIGYNPTYGNKEKTVEPHLIAGDEHPLRHASLTGETQFQDFYDKTIVLSVVGYLRPEAPFEGLEKLTEAIKGDIREAEKLSRGSDEVTLGEKRWVESCSSLNDP